MSPDGDRNQMLDVFSWLDTLISCANARAAADAQRTAQRTVPAHRDELGDRLTQRCVRVGTDRRESAGKPGSVGGSHSSAMCVAAHL